MRTSTILRTEKGRQGIDCRHCPLLANLIVFTSCVIKICKSVYGALRDLPIQYGFHIVANRRLFTQNCFIHWWPKFFLQHRSNLQETFTSDQKHEKRPAYKSSTSKSWILHQVFHSRKWIRTKATYLLKKRFARVEPDCVFTWYNVVHRIYFRQLFNNYSSSPNGLWVNSPWGRRPNGLLIQRPWGREE